MGLSGDHILLLPTNDRLIRFLIDNHSALASKFTLSTPAPEILELCYNKKLTYKKALELDIPIPCSYFPETVDEVRGISKEASYPLIIKPAVMHKLYDKKGKKAYVCRNADDLLANYAEITRIIDPSEIIIQKLIAGRAKNLYSYCSFFSDRVPIGSFIANRIRQKPMDFGISTTFAISVSNDRIEQKAVEFLTGIDYFGLSEVEFMYDTEDDTYKLIEVNPRTWKWHSIANKLDTDLIGMMIAHFGGERSEPKVNMKVGIGWIESVTDTYVVLGELLRGRMNLNEYLRTLVLEKEFACADRDDWLPALCYILFSPYLFFAR
jgi:predicted ATP-grasp superfamily ATP-dependent carboligase